MMKFRLTNAHALVVASSFLMLGGASVAGAQVAHVAPPMAQLDGRASASLAAEVRVVADSLTAVGLPVGPVVDKALEGISKGADEQRIMVAVRGVATELRIARRALGPSSDQELAAAVAALRAGSSPATLGELRRKLPARSLVVPISVLASLLVDGAPASSATVAVIDNARQTDDANLLAYGRAVTRDIASGVAPLTAISSARASVITLNSLSDPARGSHGSPSPIRSKPKPRP